ncbi:MAG: hypothetical protein QM784_05920 [Polyangiaceae bacterium]
MDLATLDAATGVPAMPSMLGQCWPTAGGAWTILVDDLTRDDDDLHGTWAIGHVDRRGRLLAAKLSSFGYTNAGAKDDELVVDESTRGDFSMLDANQMRFDASGSTFDWDGDGEDEFFVLASMTQLNRTQTMGRIWTYRSGVIRLYWPTHDLHIVGINDIDADGRPDLEVYIGGGLYLSTSYHKWMLSDPLNLIAHSLADGKFTFRERRRDRLREDDLQTSGQRAHVPTRRPLCQSVGYECGIRHGSHHSRVQAT